MRTRFVVAVCFVCLFVFGLFVFVVLFFFCCFFCLLFFFCLFFFVCCYFFVLFFGLFVCLFVCCFLLLFLFVCFCLFPVHLFLHITPVSVSKGCFKNTMRITRKLLNKQKHNPPEAQNKEGMTKQML